jgi:hypothetical protein
MELRNSVELEKHHFMVTLSSAVHHLKRLLPLFPSIEPQYAAARHTFEEGQRLRNLICRADERQAKQAEARNSGASELTDSRPGEANATSTVVDHDGHWLGGRLCVEKVVAELRPLLDAVKVIPPVPGERPFP